MPAKAHPDAELHYAAARLRRLSTMVGKSMMFRAEADDVQVDLGALYHDFFVKTTTRPEKPGELCSSAAPAWALTSDERALSAALSDADEAIRRQDVAALRDVAARLEALAGPLPDDRPADDAPAAGELDPVAVALATLVSDPTLSVRSLAKRVKVHPSTLYRSETFRSALQARRSSQLGHAKGSKYDGDIDAVAD